MDDFKTIDNSTQPVPSKIHFSKKIFVIGSILVLIVLGVLLIFEFLLGKKTAHKSPESLVNQPTPFLSIKESKTAPIVSFKNIDSKNTIYYPNPSLVSIYSLKDSFNSSEIEPLASRFGFSEKRSTESQPTDFILFENAISSTSSGFLQFNKKNGYFNLQSLGTIQVPPSSSISNQTLLFIKSLTVTSKNGSVLSLADPSLKCTTTYKLRSAPESVTFVECHQMWNELHVPLVNPVGILNLKESTKIASIIPGKTYSDTPTDPNVYQVNQLDGAGNPIPEPSGDQKARPANFNTITVGINEDGRLYNVISTMRWIDNTPTQTSSQSILTPQEALTEFKKGNSIFSLTIPAGSGSVDWKKVYPQSTTEATITRINEMSLVYVDHGDTIRQNSYKPYYLIRGTADLISGYTVQFVALIETKPKDTKILGVQNSIRKNNLQLDTFYPSVPDTPNQSAQNQTVVNGGIDCSPFNTTTENIYNVDTLNTLTIPGYDPVIVRFIRVGGELAEGSQWMFAQSYTPQSFKNAQGVLLQTLTKQYAINIARGLTKHSEKISTIQSSEDVDQLYGDFQSPTKIDYYPYPILLVNTESNRALYEEVKAGVGKIVYNAIKTNSLNTLASQSNLYQPETFPWLWEIINPRIQGTGCIISAQSPIIFITSKVPRKITLIPPQYVTYANPALNRAHSWEIAVDAQSLKANSLERSYLSYEYDTNSIYLPESRNFIIIKNSQVEKFIDTMSSELHLTREEKDGLSFEFQKALLSKSFSKPNIKIFLVSTEALNKNLPLSISPSPYSITRIHFIIVPTDDLPTSSPLPLKPVERSEYSVVEIGVSAR